LLAAPQAGVQGKVQFRYMLRAFAFDCGETPTKPN
jgi:hypothetical protein